MLGREEHRRHPYKLQETGDSKEIDKEDDGLGFSTREGEGDFERARCLLNGKRPFSF